MATFRERDIREGKNLGVGVDIVNGCNLECAQCFYRKGETPRGMISLKQMNLIINAVKGRFSELYILGGEPTLHPCLPQILERAALSMERVILVTNGIKLAQESYCKQTAVPGVAISMHRKAISSRARELVDRLNRRKGSFELSRRAWENVEKYWQGDIFVQLNLLKPLIEQGCAMEVFKWARKKGYEPIIELVKAGPIFARGNKLDVPLWQIRDLFEKMLAFDRKYFPEKAPDKIVPPYYGYTCTLIETSIHVKVDGAVIPCVGNPTPSYGNIFRDDIGQILDSPLRKAIQDYRRWIAGLCRECVFFDYCRGGCRGEARWETGCLRASDPYCWHHPKGATLREMVPESCEGCILENYPGCAIKI